MKIVRFTTGPIIRERGVPLIHNLVRIPTQLFFR
jgi:hypothetical protein